jgi:hypothetical protein
VREFSKYPDGRCHFCQWMSDFEKDCASERTGVC